jgi:hypothetical protein
MGIELGRLAEAVHAFCQSEDGKKLFKKWTFKADPNHGGCYAVASAAHHLFGEGDIVAVGYIAPQQKLNGGISMYRPTHMALKADGWILDGTIYKPVNVALQNFRRRWYWKPYYADKEVYIKPVCAEDFEDWVWQTHPYFVDQVIQGIRDLL